MAKAQGKKAATAAGGKGAAKKVASKIKSAAKAVKKKVAPKKAAAPPKPAAKKAAPPPKPVAKKPVPKPAPKPAPKKAAPKVAKAAAKPVRKAAAKVKAVAQAAAKKVAVKVTPKAAEKAAPKAAAATAKAALKPKAVKPTTLPSAPVAPNVPDVPKPAPAPAPAPAAEEKKRGRRARPRVTSSGAPAASWLSSEKPRPASFIAAPARAEAPSAVAAPPASSDRLIREEDLAHPAVRIVPIRVDVEQGAGRYYVIASPIEVSVRVGEGLEWDFRYLGGADVNVEEIVIEFEKPSPFAQNVFRTKKPGGARPHRQLSGGAVAGAAGRRVQYTVRAMNQFRTELADTKVWLTVTA